MSVWLYSFVCECGCIQNPGFRIQPHACGWMVKTHACGCIHGIIVIYSTAGGKVSCVPRYPTVSHKFPRDILCPVVIRSISENFCDYHGTWLSSRYNHRNFQTWVITTELSGHDVSRGNLWDTVGYRETRGNFTTSSTVVPTTSLNRLLC